VTPPALEPPTLRHGRCRSESFEGGGEGYRFDTGPSLMLLPDRYREQFTAVGKKLEVRQAIVPLF
jgi:phytoene dehydrogenase-like protein